MPTVLTLEDFIKYNYNFVVDDIRYSDPTAFNRLIANYIEEPVYLTQEQFTTIMTIFEPYRVTIDRQIANGTILSKLAVVIDWRIRDQINNLLCSNFGK